MRNDPVRVTWDVEPALPDTAEQLKAILAEQTDLNRTLIDRAVTFPDHQAVLVAREHRLRDYFEKITLETGPRAGGMVLSFHRRPADNGVWKDLMMAIVRSLQAADANVTLRRDASSQRHHLGPRKG